MYSNQSEGKMEYLNYVMLIVEFLRVLCKTKICLFILHVNDMLIMCESF